MIAARPPTGGFAAFRSFVRWSVGQVGGSGTVLSPLALLEPIAVAVHLEDMEVMVSRSSSAPVSRSEANTPVHSSNGRLLVAWGSRGRYALLSRGKSFSALPWSIASSVACFSPSLLSASRFWAQLK